MDSRKPSYKCEYCESLLSTTSSLNYHQKHTKMCLRIQGKMVDTQEKCEFCDKILSSKTSMKRHMVICKYKHTNVVDDLHDAHQEIELLKNTIKELRADKKDLQ